MSWESTIPYYRLINEAVRERLGGLHSARIILYSIDFHEIERLQEAGDWEAAGALLAGVAQTLESAGADFLVLCTNTMHKLAPEIGAAARIPLLHIADPCAEAVKDAGFSRVGLLGTRFTMEEAFYAERLQQRHGLSLIVPKQEDRETVHRVIFDELCRGSISEISRQQYREIIDRLVCQGAEAIILGCTEISLLIDASGAAVPLFDTTRLHARKAAEWALGQGRS